MRRHGHGRLWWRLVAWWRRAMVGGKAAQQHTAHKAIDELMVLSYLIDDDDSLGLPEARMLAAAATGIAILATRINGAA